MSFLSNIEAIFQKDETWVIGFFAELKKDVAILEADAVAAISWLSAHGAEITADVTGLLSLVAKLGLGLPPPVAAALSGLNIAVALVNQAANAVSAAKAGGASDSQALAAAAQAGVQAYNSLKAAQVLTSTAQASVATGTSAAPIVPPSS